MQLIHQFTPASPPAASITAVLLHGRGFDLNAMKIFERILPKEVSKLYLQAPFEDPEGGFCWWNMFSNQSPNAALDLLLSDLEDARERFDLGGHKLVGYGFSQGAAMLSGVIQAQPTLFASVAMLVGVVLEQRKQPVELGSANVLMLSGLRDERVPIAKARAGASFLKKLGFQVEFLEEDVGHKVGVEGMRRLKEWSLEQV